MVDIPFVVTETDLPGVLTIVPNVFGDDRGFSKASMRLLWECTGVTHSFVQDNHSKSSRGVLRGLLPVGKPQRLVRN